MSSAETAAFQALENRVQIQSSQLQSQQALIDKLIQSQQKQQDSINRLLQKCEEQRDLIDKLHQKCTQVQENIGQPRPSLPSADVESVVDARFQVLQETLIKSTQATIEKIVQAAIANFAASMANKITTLDAKVDGLAAQQNNFIAHVKKTYVTKENLNASLNDIQPDRKRARANGRSNSHSVSPTRERREGTELTQDGGS